MAFQYIVILALVSFALATPIEYHHEPIYHHEPVHALVKHIEPVHVKHVEYEAPPKYDFSYGVHDEHTGDIKTQSESRDHDKVHGSYSLIDADGFKRTVEYTADDHNGFNAVVHREPIGHKIVAQPVHKVIQPVIAHYDDSHYHHH